MSYPESLWSRLNDALDESREVSVSEALARACAVAVTDDVEN